MNTLIELYDERAIENILAPDMFRPRRIVYLCPGEIAQDRTRQETLAAFFRRRGWEPELIFVETSLFKADRILRQLFTIGERFEDFFLMAGGTLLPGRVDNQILSQYLPDFDPFFDCFLQFRRDWPNIISYIQRISPSEYGQTPPLSVQGGYTVKGERGSRNTANEDALRELARIDFIQDLEIVPGQQVSFRFRDLNTRAWLRDVGSALELYAYKACVDSAIFHDVISSAVVRWDEVLGHGSVSNEIDVMAARGVIPLFLSCKACDIKTEALNELAILRDRFGGKGAKAAIVTTEVCNAAARHRAAQLGIAVIDLEELKTGLLVHRLKVIMKAE